MEFTRINSAATAETSFTLAHPSSRRRGLRKIPPRPSYFRGFGILPGEKAIGGGQQHDPHDRLDYMRGQAEVASQEAEGDGGCRERPEHIPGEMPGAREIEGGDRRNQDVQDQRGRLEGGGSKAEKGQDGDVPGCPAVADAGVEDRHREDAGREKQQEGSAHGYTISFWMRPSALRWTHPKGKGFPDTISLQCRAESRSPERDELPSYCHDRRGRPVGGAPCRVGDGRAVPAGACGDGARPDRARRGRRSARPGRDAGRPTAPLCSAGIPLQGV
ncbi:MAG: hypothetical protein HW377_2607 [Actinobacteria bacterium]|nr:hypothetical protein [Actinomycetota bacterium]